MLMKTGVKIADMSMHDFIKKARRGGISKACKRSFKATNPKMGKAFTPSKPTSWISYVDVNNLYGWALSQFLPIGNYQWEASREYYSRTQLCKRNISKRFLELSQMLNVGIS